MRRQFFFATVIAALPVAIAGCPRPAAPAPRPAAAQPQRAAQVVARASIELLHSVPSAVAVSSTVQNNSDQPAHLVDGDLTTAWSSRTGDLTTAWISFRVPSLSHVTAIKLTAGYTKETRTADLFTQNQRIGRVRVTRAGTVLGEFPLDPERRDLQTIPLDAAGGDFTVSFIDVHAGSRPAWREACVSEFEVWGQPPVGTEITAHNAPGVSVGSIEIPTFDSAQAARREVRAARDARRLTEAGTADAAIAPSETSEVDNGAEASGETDPDLRYLIAREREADAIVELAQMVCTRGQPIVDTFERYRRLQAEIAGYRAHYAESLRGRGEGELPSPSLSLVRAALLNRQTAIDAITSRSRCGADPDVSFRIGREAEILAPAASQP